MSELRCAELPTGVRVRYTDDGPAAPDTPVVLLSHGFLLDHRMFAPQVGELARDHRVVAWDQRGHGGTPAAGPFSYWDSAADALALLDHLRVARAVLVGMSQGGFLSLRAALLAPTRVRGLVLIDSQAGREDPDAVALFEAMHESWLRGPSEHMLERVFAIAAGPDLELSAPFRADALARPPASFTNPFRALMDRDDITPRLGELSMPALVVHGGADSAIPLLRAQQLAAALPGAGAVHVVAGASHASNLSHPGEVNALLRAFLAGLPAERAAAGQGG